MDVFSIMPIEAFMDDRLTKTDLRVLGAILSWRNKNTNVCWPKREQIAERTNLPLCKISTSTTSLVALGWLIKEGDGGKSKPSKYTLVVPEIVSKTLTDSVTQTVTDLVTVTEPVTLTDSVTQTVTDLVTQTVTELVRGNKQKEKQKEKQKTTVVVKPDKFCIPRDWKPSDRCKELLARAGIGEDFYYQLIDEFVLYWEEQAEKRAGWDSTFLNHAKRQWQQPRAKQLGGLRNGGQQAKPAPEYIPPELRGGAFTGNYIDSTARKL